MTIKERLIAALESRGWIQDVNARSTKYHVMRQPDSTSQAAARFFIGRAGALRYYAQGRASACRPQDRLKAKLLGEKT